MHETLVTLTGWLGSNVTLRQAAGVPVASFRVATTPRRYQKSTESWADGETQWFSVNTWRTLAEHCDASLRRGDPVIIHGKLTARPWTNKDGWAVTSFDVEAAFVGHDLTRGTSAFTRRKPPTPQIDAQIDAPVGASGDVSGDVSGDTSDDANQPKAERSAGIQAA